MTARRLRRVGITRLVLVAFSIQISVQQLPMTRVNRKICGRSVDWIFDYCPTLPSNDMCPAIFSFPSSSANESNEIQKKEITVVRHHTKVSVKTQTNERESSPMPVRSNSLARRVVAVGRVSEPARTQAFFAHPPFSVQHKR